MVRGSLFIVALLMAPSAALQVSTAGYKLRSSSAATSFRSGLVQLQQDPEPEPTKGIMGVLGGGKTSDQIEKNPVAEIGSLVGFVVVICAFIFGAVNPDFVEARAKSQAVCVQGKIVNGKRTQCNPDGTYIRN